MATGFCPALLSHLADIAGTNYPGQKVTMPGFTKFLYDQPDRPISVGEMGHRRTVNVRYMNRGSRNVVSTTPGCTVDSAPAFKETSVPLTLFVQKGIWFGDDQIRQYCEEYSNTVAVGAPATQMMQFVVEGLLANMNSVYSKMESLLLTKLGLNMGTHVATGTAAAVSVNIKQDGTVNDLGTGLTKLLMDAEANEFCGAPAIVYGMGSKFHAYDMQNKARALGRGDSGIDQGALAAALGYTGYSSAHATAALGNADNIAMVGSGQVHLVENLRNKGAFAGTRGTSTFGTLVDPRTQCWGGVPVEWDFQAKYIDCAEDLTTAVGNGYINSNTLTSDRGTLLIVSKYFDLFVTPSDAYDGGDRLSGGDRPLLYTITNS